MLFETDALRESSSRLIYSFLCYSLYWQMRHELISSEEGEGGEGRGKAAA